MKTSVLSLLLLVGVTGCQKRPVCITSDGDLSHYQHFFVQAEDEDMCAFAKRVGKPKPYTAYIFAERLQKLDSNCPMPDLGDAHDILFYRGTFWDGDWKVKP
jgi:hypothetical protein